MNNKVRESLTRDQASTAIQSMGIEGLAHEILMKETGLYRHRLRMKSVESTSLEKVREIYTKKGFDERYLVRENFIVPAAALCAAEILGVGGPDGVAGMSTDRQSCFQALGKGRKQATDGPAWDAAIAECCLKLLAKAAEEAPYGKWEFAAGENGAIFLQHISAVEESAKSPPEADEESGDLEKDINRIYDALPPVFKTTLNIQVDVACVIEKGHLTTIAREGLRRAAGLNGWFENPIVGFSKMNPNKWGEVVNKIYDLEEIAV